MAIAFRHGIVGTVNRFTMWHFGELVATVEHSPNGDWVVETPDGSRHSHASRPEAIRRCASLAQARDPRMA